MRVPNQFPILPIHDEVRIAVIGEAPGSAESDEGKPFIGPSGRLLDAALGQVGLVRDRCFVGNVCQVMPARSSFDTLSWDSKDVQADIAQLQTDLDIFQPTMILCLGNAALHLAKEGNVAPRKTKKGFQWPNAVSNWRGSLFWSPLFDCKTVAAYHPANLLRGDFENQPYFRFDLQRLAEESKTEELVLPEREIRILRSISQVETAFAHYKEQKKLLSLDIEGGVAGVTAISFSDHPLSGIVIPFCQNDGVHCWTEAEEFTLWMMLQELLEDPSIPKCLQNSLYDSFVLAWSYGILISNVREDTMLKWWELFPELEKKLGVQVSILTKEPFYKSERLAGDDKTEWIYCAKDSCVTLECCQAMDEILDDGQRDHYNFNMDLLTPVLFMELRGMPWDKEKAKQKYEEIEDQIWELQALINKEAATGKAELKTAIKEIGEGKTECLLRHIANVLCKANPKEDQIQIEQRWQPKRWNGKKWVKSGKLTSTIKIGSAIGKEIGIALEEAPQDKTLVWLEPKHREVKKKVPVEINSFERAKTYAKDSCVSNLHRILGLLRNDDVSTNSKTAQICQILLLSPNVASTQSDGDAQWFLYDHCKLPKQFKKEKGRKTEKVSTDQDALVALYAKTKDERALWVLQMRRLRKAQSDLLTEVDPDGRVRGSYTLVKETGRMSCSKSPTGRGANFQAWSRHLRSLICAGEGRLMAKCDLEGADSWTVAAECAVLGDDTMLLDLQAGLKPAKIIALSYQEGSHVNEKGREWLQDALRAPFNEKWIYPASKAVNHGTAYLMGIPTVIQTILKGSMKDLPIDLKEARPIVLSTQEAVALQNAVLSRYEGLKKWHTKEGMNLLNAGVLKTSVGHVRRFYGRKREFKQGMWAPNHKTLGNALSSKPQFYTTYATKLALWKCWFDQANRIDDPSLQTGFLRVEPVHAVHDELDLSFAESDEPFARESVARWFDNELEIAGQKITIPFEMEVGKNWSMK